MAGYVCLAKFTPQGIGSIGNMPAQLRQARSTADTMGIRLVGIWVTMGAYDVAMVADAPDDSVMARFALGVARQGHMTTSTMRALSEEEFAQIAGQVS
jgi:uncharacterized protein with GYD domain